MKKEEEKQFIRCCNLGALGGILMAAGDWLLGCVPFQKTDTDLFNRAYYLSGSYALWKPALVIGPGTIGCFLYIDNGIVIAFFLLLDNANCTLLRKNTP